ncbi:GNAT family N-acetyltransferase [Bifidobacterium gallicum]
MRGTMVLVRFLQRLFRTVFQANPAASPETLLMPASIEAPDGAVPIRLRPLIEEDEYEWSQVRAVNTDWLGPWESTDPEHGANLTFAQWIARQRAEECAGTGIIFAIEYQGVIVGQISLGAVSFGALRSGIVGYWVDHRYAGHGFAPLAVTMLADWAMFAPVGPHLHRLGIDILPSNHRSRRVVEKVQATYEGVRRAYMYINGVWEDHESYAIVAQDAPEGFTKRLLERSNSTPPQ